MPDHQVLKIRIEMNTPNFDEQPMTELALILLCLAHQALQGELESWMDITDGANEYCGELQLVTEGD